MSKFKLIFAVMLTLILTACLDSSQGQFFSTRLSDDTQKFEYQDIHQLKLAISELVKEVDESGFSPILKTHFTLKDLSNGPWPQAWVAFNIKIYVKDEELALISKANVMQDHRLTVSFEQHLPKFGIRQDDLKIQVMPVAWMPTFPLHIMSDSTINEALNVSTSKTIPNKVSALP